ncbi:hypothetical protein HMN09_01092000 [Mycena chlorophos]|uniref:Uncharacterized protein n=1 Tax=Mycena chlorophos TaxID=658473 RepID=A0A8H6SE72_MYCCL|nr:hypothetical protein HMN09_01092000 [Mycena chlorophos]
MATEDPCLPPELEREIFELTAQVHPEMRFALLFVAQRALTWIQPLLYRKLFIHSKQKHPDLTTTPPHFFEIYTRHLILFSSQEAHVEAVRLCPNTTHLAISDETPLPQSYDVLLALRHLKRLACWSGALAPSRDTLTREFAAERAFACLTHLEIFDDVVRPLLTSFVVALPSLTHLALNVPSSNLTSSWSTLADMLQEATHWEVLVILNQFRSGARDVADTVPTTWEDDRLVATWYVHWTEGIMERREGLSYWVVAEGFIARKRKNPKSARSFYAVWPGSEEQLG